MNRREQKEDISKEEEMNATKQLQVIGDTKMGCLIHRRPKEQRKKKKKKNTQKKSMKRMTIKNGSKLQKGQRK